MVQVKDTNARYVAKRKNIIVSDVWVDANGVLVDENGSVGKQIAEFIPKGVDTFSFKVSFEINDDDDSDGLD